MFTRRTFVQQAGLIVAAGLAPRLARGTDITVEPFTVVPVGDDAWMIKERGGNVLLIATDDGPILVDAKVATAGPMLRREVRHLARSESGPRFLINTHHHADHVGGNYAFKDAEILAHEKLEPRLADTLSTRIVPALVEAAGPGVPAPALTVDDFAADRAIGAKGELGFGGRMITMRHFGPGHTDNDLVVYIPEMKIVHVGDLLFYRLNPYIDKPGGATTRGWEKSVQAVIDMIDDDTKVIPGHGELTDRAGLAEQIVYFQTMRAFVEERVAAGDDRATIEAATPPKYEDYGLERLRPRVLGAIYDELQGE